MKYSFSLSSTQHSQLKNHLFPGDGLEAVALIFCHQAKTSTLTKLVAFEVVLVNNDDCIKRTSAEVSWDTKKYLTPQQIEKMDTTGVSLFTIHSHPTGFDQFSQLDDDNDKKFFPCVNGWFDDDRVNGATVMLPDGQVFGRIVDAAGSFTPLSYVNVSGESIKKFYKNITHKSQKFSQRIEQTFGKGTLNLLRQLKVGVVGCSGTGSILIELLARNCIGEIVIVDPDIVEEKNLNRIINSSLKDAKIGSPKVEIIKNAIDKMGLDVKVTTYQSHTSNIDVVSELKTCDVLFGCVDSAIGRYHLDCIAAAYLIPYFDVGVQIESDGNGSISQAIMVSNYIEPCVSSLFSVGVYTNEQVSAESLKMYSPDQYEKQKEEGYIIGIDEDQPAVISINMQASCLAVNDFLARIHNYRLDSNNEFDIQKMSFTHGYYQNQKNCYGVSNLFKKELGKADKSQLIKSIII